MKMYTRVWAPIDLDAVVYNMESMKKNLNPGTEMVGVVKTDGYGHGAVPIAKVIDPFVAGYAVATPEEAYVLRRHGVAKWILVLGVSHESQYEEMIRQQVRPSIFTMEQAKPFSETAQRLGVKAPIHFALDTGMGRIGMTPDEKGADLAKAIADLPGIETEGLFTHFARADEADREATIRQYERYQHFCDLLKERGVEIPLRHCSNSAAIIDFKEMHMGLVRAGISIYGMYPSDEVKQDIISLKPAMALKSFITYIKEIGPGTEVSYGGTFKAEKTMRIATVSAGYGDGYPRNLSGKGEVLIHGKRAKILGRICMDQFMADLTGIPEAKEGDSVTLVGRDGNQEITMEELAEISGGFHYEIPCLIGKRVPRRYVKNGKEVGGMMCRDEEYEGF